MNVAPEIACAVALLVGFLVAMVACSTAYTQNMQKLLIERAELQAVMLSLKAELERLQDKGK